MTTADGKYKIYLGKVEEICTGWKASHFDACLCDPPYLLQFMGKEFDKQHKRMAGINEGQKMQAWHERWTREVLRVLKPGAHMLAFGGTRTYHRLTSAAEDVGFVVEDTLQWLHGQGFPKGKSKLKPAQEPIVLARKPGANGYLNLDECRIGTSGGGTHCNNRDENGKCLGHDNAGRSTSGETFHGPETAGGRWPANLILSHHEACNDSCHPDCPVRLLDAHTLDKIHSAGAARRGSKNPRPAQRGSTIDFLQGSEKTTGDMHRFGDAGGASRFFYCAKVSTRERNLGGIDCRHPTLKPISLTTYLSRLLLPPARADHSPRRLLVPFSGAGSEIIGALLAGWDQVIGVEMDAESVSWARARIKAVRNGEFKL